MNRLAALVLLILAGCGAASKSSSKTDEPASPTASAGSEHVTLYLPGMNKRLKIL